MVDVLPEIARSKGAANDAKRLFIKNTGLCEVERRCIGAEACPVLVGQTLEVIPSPFLVNVVWSSNRMKTICRHIVLNGLSIRIFSLEKVRGELSTQARVNGSSNYNCSKVKTALL